MAHILTGRWKAVFFISALNPRHKKYRKHLHSGLSSRATSTHIPILEAESRTLLRGLAASPDAFYAHIQQAIGAIILRIAYGWQVTGADDALLAVMDETVAIGAQLSQPGRWLVNFVPWLRFIPAWVPGAGFKRFAAHCGERLSRIDRVPFAWAKEQIVGCIFVCIVCVFWGADAVRNVWQETGDYVESFVSMGLKNEEGETLDAEGEDVLKWSAAALFVGGADTVSLTPSLARTSESLTPSHRAPPS